MEKHLGTDLNIAKEGTIGAHKHKKGYQLYKDKYVKQVFIKSDVKKEDDQLYFIVKGYVDASLKRINYIVYVRLKQNTREVAYCHCITASGKLERCCGTVISVQDYIQLDAKVIPDDLTCTQLLEQCHVPRNLELDEPILFNDVVFKRASYKKSESGKNQKKLKTSNNIVEVVIPLKTIFLNSYVRKYISLFFQRV